MRPVPRLAALAVLAPLVLVGCHSWRRSAARDFQASFPSSRDAARETIEISQATECYYQDRVRELLGDEIRIVVHVDLDLSTREVFAAGVDPGRVVDVKEEHSESAEQEKSHSGGGGEGEESSEDEEGGEGEEDEEGAEEGGDGESGEESRSEEHKQKHEVKREAGEMRVHSVEMPYRVIRRTATLLVPGSWLQCEECIERYRRAVANAIGADSGDVTVAPIPGTEGDMKCEKCDKEGGDEEGEEEGEEEEGGENAGGG